MGTIEEMDAEHARMQAHLKWLKADVIAELEELIAETRYRPHREFLEQRLAEVKARPVGDERTP
jgi:hypothetical protein